MRTLMAIDTSYLFYRAFFGLPGTLVSPDGFPVNAVRGTCDFLTRWIGDFSPDEVVCAWDDDWRPAWRVELVPSYKAHRVGADGGEDVDKDLARQIPWVRQALEAVGIPVVGAAQYEADDVLASLAAKHDGKTLVVSGDRDLLQLASESTSVVYVGKSVSKPDLMTPQHVRQRYGIPADRYVDYAVLRGDPSDGLPGVAGIGEKTAVKLVSEFSSLEAMLEAAEDQASTMRPAVRRHLCDSADYLAKAMRVVITVDTLPLESVQLRSPDSDAVAVLTSELGLGSSLERLANALVAAK